MPKFQRKGSISLTLHKIDTFQMYQCDVEENGPIRFLDEDELIEHMIGAHTSKFTARPLSGPEIGKTGFVALNLRKAKEPIDWAMMKFSFIKSAPAKYRTGIAAYRFLERELGRRPTSEQVDILMTMTGAGHSRGRIPERVVKKLKESNMN